MLHKLILFLGATYLRGIILAAPGSIPSISEEIFSLLLRSINSTGKGKVDSVDRTHLALVSGKPVVKKLGYFFFIGWGLGSIISGAHPSAPGSNPGLSTLEIFKEKDFPSLDEKK